MDTHGQDDTRPTYQRLADDLRTDIRSGKLGPGQKLPSVRKLAEQYGVAQMTATSAVRALHTEGLIYTISGRGTFVRETLPPSTRHDPIGTLADRVERLEERVRKLESRL